MLRVWILAAVVAAFGLSAISGCSGPDGDDGDKKGSSLTTE